MARKKKLLGADLMCGAGGSSTGCARALKELGLEMELVCVNHWPTAIETHTKNHPTARHYCQDISTVRPHIVVPEGYLDLLMASPSCTHHSVARGGKPTSDQQRSDPWHIVTWLTELRVKRIIIENVWEFINWGPVDARTGRPIQSRKGEYFQAWIETIKRLGFDPEWRKLNAADFGDATTRQRFILMARSDRKQVHWPMPTHRKRDESGVVEMFPTQKPWRAAREIIDWKLEGRSIFSRNIPLAPKTLDRILAGAVKFSWPTNLIERISNERKRSLEYIVRSCFKRRWKPKKKKDRLELRKQVRIAIHQLRHFDGTVIQGLDGKGAPMIVTLRNHGTGRSVEQPIPALAAEGQHVALALPFVCGNRSNNQPKSTDEPVAGITTANGGGQFVAEPVIMNARKNAEAKSVNDAPIPTLDTKGGVWLAEPIVLSPQNSGAARSVDEPISTLTTGGAGAAERPGCARPMLVEPFILNRFSAPGEERARVHSVEDPAPTSTGRGSGYLIEPKVAKAFVLSRQAEGAPRSTEEPMPTQTAVHSPVLIAPYYGSGSGETCSSENEPLPTITAKNRCGMVVPVTQKNGGPGARDVADPVPTMTTAKGGEFAIVMPVTHDDGSQRARDAHADPLQTVTGANRGDLAVITAQFGEREGQAPRVHSIEEPAPTVTATGHINLAIAEDDDVLFRMLEPHELAAAMGFTDEEAQYEFAGTKTDKIKQIGNAVSVAKMRACVGAIMKDAVVAEKPAAKTKKREVA